MYFKKNRLGVKLKKLLRPLAWLYRGLKGVSECRRLRKHISGVDIPKSGVAAGYITREFPAPPPRRDQPANGGAIKMVYLAEDIPASPDRCNVLYAVSSVLHPQTSTILAAARHRGMKIVWNQNGVCYRGWFGEGWEEVNKNLARSLHQADYVIYQTRFCEMAADKFLGSYAGPKEVMFNPVDLSHFTPTPHREIGDELILCTVGSATAYYRLESALRAVSLVAKEWPRLRFLIAGSIIHQNSDAIMARTLALIQELNLSDHVTFLGPFTQQDAPDIYRQAHILVHTPYNDNCPTVVQEAMACGLPVAYSDSGGTPELVGPDAGIGVSVPLDWENRHPLDPAALAAAILRITDSWPDKSQAARERAVEHFDLQQFNARHRAIFERLLEER